LIIADRFYIEWIILKTGMKVNFPDMYLNRETSESRYLLDFIIIVRDFKIDSFLFLRFIKIALNMEP